MEEMTDMCNRWGKDYWAFKLMHNKKSVLALMGSVAMEHKAFDRLLPNITCDKILFPD
ncbi:hypothetical protein [uncultured Bacteroides sp.]|uniref:hypothetical protein n=1 Tax=uncultured Bacteroides sp. TaxID=162156 RepID=UPI002592A127|nr:hypothetical protein [uncultured Bacteroides sp.]